MKLEILTGLMLTLNAAIDTGDYQDISVAEVEGHIKKGELIAYLKQRLGSDASLLGPMDAETSKELNEQMQDQLTLYEGRERRKLGVENSGLCLLIGFVLQIILDREWT